MEVEEETTKEKVFHRDDAAAHRLRLSCSHGGQAGTLEECLRGCPRLIDATVHR